MTKPKKEPLRVEQVRDKVLMLVRGGNTLPAALGACGVPRQRLHEWRAAAASGKRVYGEFFEAVQRANDEGEVNDVIVTARAANLDTARVPCQNCGASVTVNAAELASLTGQMATAQSVKASAAEVAFRRLAVRNPQRWSPRVVHTIEEEHTRFLDVAQRVLAPETFRLLCEAYVAEADGPAPSGAGGGQPGPGPVH